MSGDKIEAIPVHITGDDTKAPPVRPNIVGMPRCITIRTAASLDGPQLIVAHAPNRIRAFVSPLYGAASGVVWVCDSESSAQATPPIGYPLVSSAAAAFLPDCLEDFATTELWAIADPANTNAVTLRIWTEVRS